MATSQSKGGGYLLVIAAILFIAVMVIVQAYYPCTKSAGCYNIGTNPISDLGNTGTSPLWPLFNYGLIVFGAIFFCGIVISLDSFPKGALGTAGIIFLILSAFGGMGVGVVPENEILSIHSTFAAIAFVAGGLGMLLIGIEMARNSKFKTYYIYSIISGLITLVVFFVSVLHIGVPHLVTSGSGFGFGAVGGRWSDP